MDSTNNKSPKKRKGLRRTPFKRKPFNAKKSREDSNKIKKYTRLKAGKKTAEWDAIRAELKEQFLSMGITYCEINYDSHCRKHVDGFAHTLKRRNMGKWETEEREANLREVVAACNYCHDKVEMQGEEAMKAFLQNKIHERNERLKKWKKIT